MVGRTGDASPVSPAVVTPLGTIFDSRGRFWGSSYPMKIVDFEVLRDVAIATNFGTKIAITASV